MSSTLPAAAGERPRKMLTMRGESLRKRLADYDDEAAKRRIGRVLERALLIAGITKQDAAFRAGYGDNQSPISRWISGLETAQIGRLWDTLGPSFRRAFIVALAHDSGEGVEVRQVVTIRDEVSA
jgi:hypothetical protein